MKTPKGISKCREPGFSARGSKAWKKVKILLNGGHQAEGTYESGSGKYFYFKFDGFWRCGKLSDFASVVDEDVIDLRFEERESRSKPQKTERDPRKVWIAFCPACDKNAHYIATGESQESAMASLSEYMFPDSDDPVEDLDKAIEAGSPVETWEEEVRV